MEGTVTSYIGTTLIVNVTSTLGSGTYASWSISLSGAPGPQGSTGATGVTGLTGAQGATGLPGDQGATGATGVAGPQGATGLTGGQGATGPAGPNNVSGTTTTTLVGLLAGNGTNVLVVGIGTGLQYSDDTLAV